jgi:hypothetical protein
MARFPKGLVLAAAILELMILTINGHGATVPLTPSSMAAGVAPGNSGAAPLTVKFAAPTAAVFAEGESPVLGLVRAEPPRGSKTYKQQKQGAEKRTQPKSNN